jgi:hypothetical protein
MKRSKSEVKFKNDEEQEVWLRAYMAILSSPHASSTDHAALAADNCLYEFRQRVHESF